MQNLQLTRPLVVFDLETTGANVYRDRIVEFAGVTLYPDGHRERFYSFESVNNGLRAMIPANRARPPDLRPIVGTDEIAKAFKLLSPSRLTIRRSCGVTRSTKHSAALSC